MKDELASLGVPARLTRAAVARAEIAEREPGEDLARRASASWRRLPGGTFTPRRRRGGGDDRRDHHSSGLPGRPAQGRGGGPGAGDPPGSVRGVPERRARDDGRARGALRETREARRHGGGRRRRADAGEDAGGGVSSGEDGEQPGPARRELIVQERATVLRVSVDAHANRLGGGAGGARQTGDASIAKGGSSALDAKNGGAKKGPSPRHSSSARRQHAKERAELREPPIAAPDLLPWGKFGEERRCCEEPRGGRARGRARRRRVEAARRRA